MSILEYILDKLKDMMLQSILIYGEGANTFRYRNNRLEYYYVLKDTPLWYSIIPQNIKDTYDISLNYIIYIEIDGEIICIIVPY